MPKMCACGSNFSVDHAMSCTKGGFPSIRHNEIRDLTATLLTEVCQDVCIEPGLQLISNEVLTDATTNTQDGALLDIAANGFWGGTYQKTFFDVRVFNPHTPSNRHGSLPSCYRKLCDIGMDEVLGPLCLYIRKFRIALSLSVIIHF